MQYVSSAAFLLAVYSTYLSVAKAHLDCPDGPIQPQGLLNFVKSQVSNPQTPNTPNLDSLQQVVLTTVDNTLWQSNQN